MTSTLDIRWSTDLVTFFDPPHWGLPAQLSYDEWEATFDAEPRRFFETMLDEAAQAGLQGVELAPAPGGFENVLRAYGSPAAFGHALSARGLVLSSSYLLPVWLTRILSATTPGEIAEHQRAARELWRRHAAFVRALGCQTVVTSTVPRAVLSETAGVPASEHEFAAPADAALLERVADELNSVAEVAAAEGAQVAVHTDAYSLCSRGADVDRLMAMTSPEHVHLCIDAGHIALDGGDPLEVLSRHAGRAPILHWKDCAAPLSPHTLSGPPMDRHDVMIRSFRLVGTGILDWHEWTRILRREQWAGWGVAELDMSPDPINEIRAGLQYFEDELADI